VKCASEVINSLRKPVHPVAQRNRHLLYAVPERISRLVYAVPERTGHLVYSVLDRIGHLVYSVPERNRYLVDSLAEIFNFFGEVPENVNDYRHQCSSDEQQRACQKLDNQGSTDYEDRG
jgi:hypothetical protein